MIPEPTEYDLLRKAETDYALCSPTQVTAYGSLWTEGNQMAMTWIRRYEAMRKRVAHLESLVVTMEKELNDMLVKYVS